MANSPAVVAAASGNRYNDLFILVALTKGNQYDLKLTSVFGYSVPAVILAVLDPGCHLDKVPSVKPFPVGQVILFKLPKLPNTNRFPEAILTLPDVKINADFILTPSAFQITLGEAVAVLVTSN